jgi:hypothetical protein
VGGIESGMDVESAKHFFKKNAPSEFNDCIHMQSLIANALTDSVSPFRLRLRIALAKRAM